MKDDEEAMVMAGRSRWGNGVQGKGFGRWSFDIDVKEGYLSPKVKVVKLEAEYSEAYVGVPDPVRKLPPSCRGLALSHVTGLRFITACDRY